ESKFVAIDGISSSGARVRNLMEEDGLRFRAQLFYGQSSRISFPTDIHMGCLFGFGRSLRFLVSLAAILASPVYVVAQRPPGPPPSGPSPPNSSPSPTGASSKSSASVTLQVSVRETTGSPLPASAVVQLSNLSGPL